MRTYDEYEEAMAALAAEGDAGATERELTSSHD